MTRRLGVFAATDGWRLVEADWQALYPTREDAMAAALKEAHLARWRGASVEVLAQDEIGGPLLPIVEPPPSGYGAGA